MDDARSVYAYSSFVQKHQRSEGDRSRDIERTSAVTQNMYRVEL